jgi:hypothetical protein
LHLPLIDESARVARAPVRGEYGGCLR